MEFKFKFKFKQPCCPLPSSQKQQSRKSEDETLLEYLLESIMGFPMDSEAKQALTSAGVKSIMDLFTMEVELFGQLTYKVGSEKESLKLLDVSKLR